MIVERLIQVDGEFTDKDADELAKVLQGAAVRRALREIEAEAVASLSSILTCNLFTEEGRGKATRAQGRADGLRRALDLLVELSKEKANG